MVKIFIGSLILVQLLSSVAHSSGRQAKPPRKESGSTPVAQMQHLNPSGDEMADEAKSNGRGGLSISVRGSRGIRAFDIQPADLPKVVKSYEGEKIDNREILPITISPDKKQVLFNVRSDTNRDGSTTWLGVLDPANGTVWNLGLNTGISDMPGAVEWSPSGRRLAMVLVVGEAGPVVRVFDMSLRQKLPNIDENRLLDIYPYRVEWAGNDNELIVHGKATDGRTNKEWILNVNTGELNEM